MCGTLIIMASKEFLSGKLQSIFHTTTEKAFKRGVPVYEIAPPELFGLERMDNIQVESDPLFSLKHLRKEGQMLGGEDVIELSDGKRLIIFNTVAASSHTPLCVPYDEFADVWRKKAEKHNLDIADGILVRGAGSDESKEVPPNAIPLDIITWTMLVDKDNSVIGPIDFGDLVGQEMEMDIDSLKKYQLNLHAESDGVKLLEFYKRFTERLGMSSEVLHELYNEHIRTVMPWLPEKLPKDITSYSMIGYYRGDPVKGLQQHQDDGMGEGPQSNPTAHARSMINLRPGNLRAIQKEQHWNTTTINKELQKHKDYFKGSIVNVPIAFHQKEGVVRRDLLQQPRLLENMIKQIDPYSTVLFEILKDWLVNNLRLSSGEVRSFKHHSQLTQEEWRVAEGIEILTDQPLDESLYQINLFLGKMYDIWRDTRKAYEYYVYGFMLDGVEKKDVEKRAQYIKQAQLNYGLPTEFLESVLQLKPTEKQIAKWKKNVDSMQPTDEEESDKKRQATQKRLERFQSAYNFLRKLYENKIKSIERKIESGTASQTDLEERLKLELELQIYTERDRGYNLPGVPSFGLSFHRDEDKWHIFLSPLLSKKGVAEQWSGYVLMRQEREM